jgi:hypothetical protein
LLRRVDEEELQEKALRMANETIPAASSFPGNDQVICTLYEGDFHIGVAALINSIVKGGFRGLFWVGNRGELPPWTAQLKRRDDGLFEVGEALLGFETIESGRHFGQYKPEFLSHAIDAGIARKHVWYFDPDITVRCAWSFFERWVRHGVCLCQEINSGMMASNHPIRCEWMELASAAGWGEPVRKQERYFNSGFVGLDIAQRSFLNQWIAAVRLANSAGVKKDQFQKGTRAQTFYTVDQDTMNIATMYAQVPFSTIGPEGMGWATGGFTMYHTLGLKKPWRKKFLKLAFAGDPPVGGDKHFLESVEGPIQPYTPRQLQSLRRSAQLATLIGRFYRRSR